MDPHIRQSVKGPFTALWSRINGDGTLKLLDDAFVENLELAVNSNITLDLNGHVLYGNSDDSSRSMFTVGNGHTFNIQDSGRPVQTNTTVNSVGMVSYHDMNTARVWSIMWNIRQMTVPRQL